MSIASRTYCPRAGSLPARAIHYFFNNRSATLTPAEISMKFDAVSNGMHSNLQQAVEAGFLQRQDGIYSAGDDIDDAPDYGKLAAADATVKAAATLPNAPHNVFGTAIKPERKYSPPDKTALPDPQDIKLESGIPLPAGRSTQKDWGALLDRMKPGQSCALPKNAHASLSKVVAARHKVGKEKYAMRTSSPTEIRLWRTT